MAGGLPLSSTAAPNERACPIASRVITEAAYATRGVLDAQNKHLREQNRISQRQIPSGSVCLTNYATSFDAPSSAVQPQRLFPVAQMPCTPPAHVSRRPAKQVGVVTIGDDDMSDPEPLLGRRRVWSAQQEVRYWRERAAEVRKIMALFDDPASRAKLEEIATHYDNLAKHIESQQGER